MIVIVALIGAFLLAVVPAMAAEDSTPSTTLAFGPPDGRGSGGQYGRGNGGSGAGGTGTGFVDADGDGICDNCGNGMGFVDADGDGVCDNWDGTQLGQQGRGRRGRSL